MKNFAVFFITIALAFCRSSATERIRPTIPKIYLAAAGPKLENGHLVETTKEELLMSFKRISVCPDDYSDGLSFRCDVSTGPDFPTVVFRVGGVVYKKERRAPYYIAGDTPIKVRPFPIKDIMPIDSPEGARIRITCRVRTRKPVWVDVEMKC